MTDEELLDALRTAKLADDPVPASLRGRAVEAMAWGLGSTLAAATERVHADMRGGDGFLEFSFVAGERTIELAVEQGGERYVVRGDIDPAVPQVSVHVPGQPAIVIRCTISGAFEFELTDPWFAISFDDERYGVVRTPMVDVDE